MGPLDVRKPEIGEGAIGTAEGCVGIGSREWSESSHTVQQCYFLQST